MVRGIERTDRYLHSPLVEVHKSINQNVTPTTASEQAPKITFDTSFINENACYDFINQVWRAPKAGRIVVETQIFLSIGNNSNSDDSYLQIVTSTRTARVYQNNAHAANNFLIAYGTTITPVDLGNELYVTWTTQSTNPRVLGFGAACYLRVYYLI